jgi:hypothetical protein
MSGMDDDLDHGLPYVTFGWYEHNGKRVNRVLYEGDSEWDAYEALCEERGAFEGYISMMRIPLCQDAPSY